jgi:D-serine deaminase-like pyridoxal phosphate-dependent protein
MTEIAAASVKDSASEVYKIAGVDRALTPALAIYLDRLDANISATLKLLGNEPDRWRPHVKTAKLKSTMARLVEIGIKTFKCSTTLELRVACEAKGQDVLVAYPCAGSRAKRVLEIQASNPEVRISALVENQSQLFMWRGGAVGLFIDVNPGMNRTGINPFRVEEIISIARQIKKQGNDLRGLHYYDGHHRQPDLRERKLAAFPGYHQLLAIQGALREQNCGVDEIVTSGTPALPCALAFSGFQSREFKHRVSAGTIVYNDLNSLSQLPKEWGYQPAALVVTTVVSRPAENIITCDAGHKTVSADAGFPNCSVWGRPELEPLHPSEEHLPLRVGTGAEVPEIGDILYLVPKHVCPTVNNFDHALLIQDGQVRTVAPVSARGREAPLPL